MKKKSPFFYLAASTWFFSPLLLTACDTTNGLLGQNPNPRYQEASLNKQGKAVRTQGYGNAAANNSDASGRNAAHASSEQNDTQNSTNNANQGNANDAAVSAPSATMVAPTAAPIMTAPMVDD